VLGADHPLHVHAQVNLALCFQRLNRHEEAIEQFQQCKEVQSKQLGADQDNAFTLASMGNSFVKLGRHDAALQAFAESRPILFRTAESEPSTYLHLLEQMAHCMKALRRIPDAMKMYREWAVAEQNGAGRKTTEYARAMTHVADCLMKSGRMPEAASVHRECLLVRKEVLGDAHPEVAKTILRIADLRSKMGQFAEALDDYDQCLRMFEMSDPGYARALSNSATCLASMGRLNDALAAHEQCLAIRARTLGMEHPKTIRTLASIGECY